MTSYARSAALQIFCVFFLDCYKVATCLKKSLEKVDGFLQKSLEKVLNLWYTMCEVRK